jgi:hypothetical protein
MKNPSRFIKSLISIAVSLTLIVSFTPAAFADTDPAIITSSANQKLYAVLHEKYGLDSGGSGNIYAADLGTLSGVVDLSNTNIQDASWLAYCTGIDHLYLCGNPINQLPSNMSTWSALIFLELQNCTGIKDATHFSDIASLPNLQSLDISNTNIANVDWLKDAHNLYDLVWCDNGNLDIDLSSLQGLTQIVALGLANNTPNGHALDLSTLPALPNLKQLSVEYCMLTDISALSSYPSLTDLWIGGNEITSIAPLSTLTGITGLGINRNRIESLAPLAGMTGLHTLYANDNYIHDISGISGKTFTNLNLAHNCLNPLDGSADRAILDTFSGVDYSDQRTTDIHFACGHGTPSTASITGVYYSQAVTMPSLTLDPSSGYAFTGWDLDGDNVVDYSAGDSVPFTWTGIPFPGSVTVHAVYQDTNRLLDPGLTYGTLSPGTLNHPFDPNVFNYKLTLPEGTDSVTFTPKRVDTSAKMYINGVQRTAFTVSNLKNNASKTVKIKLVAAGKPTKTYTFTVYRDKSTNAYLSNLSVSPATLSLSPAFDAGTTDYTLILAENKAGVTIRATRADNTSTVYINGSNTRSKYISVPYGAYRTVTVKVKAQAGNLQYYTITIYRYPHVNSFSGSPKSGGKAVVNEPLGKTVKFTYSLGLGRGVTGVTSIWINDGDTPRNIVTEADTGGTHSYTWNGKIGTDVIPPGTYRVMISVAWTPDGQPTLTCDTVKYLWIVVK